MRTSNWTAAPHARHWNGWSAWRRDAWRWWHALPEALRTPWPLALSCLTIVALLTGFHQVVKDSVRQGELLRMSTATRAEAVWRCHALRQPQMRATCLEELDTQPPVLASTRPPPNTATLAVAQR